MQNKTRTSKVDALSKAQKAQIIFLEKKLEILKKKSFEKSRIVPKNVKGGPLWIYQHTFRCKISKNSKWDPLGTIKIFQKKSHSAEKNPKVRLVL